jgi:hypothetical protein
VRAPSYRRLYSAGSHADQLSIQINSDVFRSSYSGIAQGNDLRAKWCVFWRYYGSLGSSKGTGGNIALDGTFDDKNIACEGMPMRAMVWMPKMQSKTRVAVAFLVVLGCMVYRDFVSFGATGAPAPARQGPPLTDAQRTFFESKIRPVLASKCYKCHSAQAKEIEGGLLLDTRQGVLKGGEDGSIIVSGNPGASVLIQALRYGNKDLAMPPDDAGGKLPDAVIHDFETWVKMGAPDPRDGAVVAIPPKPWDPAQAKKWWSFQPLTRPQPPEVMESDWARGEIDRFVLAAMNEKNLKPVADADKQTLIRRIYFDLIGLPPTPEEMDAFVHDE